MEWRGVESLSMSYKVVVLAVSQQCQQLNCTERKNRKTHIPFYQLLSFPLPFTTMEDQDPVNQEERLLLPHKYTCVASPIKNERHGHERRVTLLYFTSLPHKDR